MQTLTLAEAAGFLHMSKETLRLKAKAGQVPAAKLAKEWVFLQTDLVEYLRSNYSQHWQVPQVPGSSETGGNIWHCENVEKSGGLISLHQVESEYDALLTRKTGKKRKSSTID